MLLSRWAWVVLAACGARGAVAPASSDDSSVASADGVAIHYRTTGAGEPTVVLVHCGGCSIDEWRDTIPVLAPTHRVVAIELAGHGASGKDRRAWSVPAFAADLRAVIDHLGIQRAILVGHSMSGPIVVEAAAEMPDKIVGVIPIDTLQDAGQVDDPKELHDFFEAMRKDYRGAFGGYVRSLFPRTADPAVVERVVGFELANDPAIAIPMLEQVSQYAAKDAFARVRAPIIAINSDLFPTNVAGNRALNARYDVRIVAGVGHWLMFEAPERFNALLAQTVAELSPRT